MTTNQEKRCTNFPLGEILSSLYFKNTAACRDSRGYKQTAIPKIPRKSDQESCRRGLKNRTDHQVISLMPAQTEKQLPKILQQHLNKAAVECSNTMPAQLHSKLGEKDLVFIILRSYLQLCNISSVPVLWLSGNPSRFTTGHKQIRLLQNQAFSSSALLRWLFHQMVPDSLPSLLRFKGLELSGPFMF